jgi:hypothetical protein
MDTKTIKEEQKKSHYFEKKAGDVKLIKTQWKHTSPG